MPGGFTRLNEKKRRPNERIAFIKPLNGDQRDIAKDILERVAAKVLPIMKDNSLSITSLDEFPPNREFWGRNWNGGECIELVLRTMNGQWLPFTQIVSVMIHELAHIREMNHSRFFWRVKNGLTEELRHLNQAGYTGEGFWARGVDLKSVVHTTDRQLNEAELPVQVCGGYRRRYRKRRRTGKKKEKTGTSLGGDENERFSIEGKFISGNPRVAQSRRGRELRAAAAARRFDLQQRGQELDEQDTSGEDEEELVEEQKPEDDREALDALQEEKMQMLQCRH